ncbi:MAG: hypothetical protein HQM09_03070, partial [Candidatus Riflebacteria bacterium]|nr:hypothetical protein [Candidatus Riflebacteria bacterium]
MMRTKFFRFENHGSATMPMLVGAICLVAMLAMELPLKAQTPFPGQNQVNQLFQDALSELSQRRLKSAREKLEKLIKEYPKHEIVTHATVDLAKILIDERSFDRAIELLIPIADRPIIDADVHNARIMLLKTLGDLQRFKQGIDLLEKWWKADSSNVDTGRNLAAFYLQSGRADEGRLLLEGLLERTADPEVFNDLLKLAVKSGGIDSLFNTIEGRKARYKSVDFLEFTVNCLIAMRQDASASQRLREAPETQDSISLLRKLARLDLDSNHPELALDSYKRVEQLGVRDWENIKAIGHCLFMLKRIPEAIRTWRLTLIGGQFSTL